MKLDSNNNSVLKEFITIGSFKMDGIIIKNKACVNYVQEQIDSQKENWNSFNSLKLFLKYNIEIFDYAFINVDENKTLTEEESLELFRKTRSKTKIIFFNEFEKTLDEVEFYKFIGWMRLITID